MKNTILFGLVTSGLLLSQSANSADIAIGALIGQSSFDDICSVTVVENCDDSDTSYGFNLTYNFNRTWGIELGYSDLGTYGGSDTIVETVSDPIAGDLDVVADASQDIDLTALYLAVNASYYFNDQFSVTGRLGVTELDLDSSIRATSTVTSDIFNITETASASESFSDSTTEAFYGISLNYNFTDALQAQLRYDLYEGDIDNFTLGLRYSFGL